MAGFRVFLLSLCVVCVCFGCATSQERFEVEVASSGPPESNPIVLNGAEICGPIYDALMYLGPKDEEGRLDMSRVGWDPVWPGHPTVYLPVPTDLVHSETLRKASYVRLDEFRGRVAGVSLLFEAKREENSPIWEALFGLTRKAPGPPLVEEERSFYRDEGRLHIVGIHDEEMENVVFSMFCQPLRAGYLEEMESASATAEAVSEAGNVEKSEDERLTDGFLGRTVLDVILSSGSPNRDPVRAGSECLGLYFEKRGYLDTPTKEWIWFVGGTAVYVGWEFPSPFNPERAVSTFFSFRRELIESLGEPAESIGGRSAQQYRAIWRDGNGETVLTLNNPEGFPRFLMEFVDPEKVGQIEGNLRPDRDSPEKQVPPPVDSAKTRHQSVAGSASG